MEETQKHEQQAATILAEKSAVEEKFFDAKQETDDHDDDVGKLVSKDTVETQDSDNGDTGVAGGASFSKSLKKRMRGKKKKKVPQPHAKLGLSNKLTKLLPGYVAPSLSSPSTASKRRRKGRTCTITSVARGWFGCVASQGSSARFSNNKINKDKLFKVFHGAPRSSHASKNNLIVCIVCQYACIVQEGKQTTTCESCRRGMV
jgi:hypothetical protein